MAYNIKQVAKAISLTIGTPAVTITDIEDWNYESNVQKNKRVAGPNYYPRITLGESGDTITIKTTDLTKFNTLHDGTQVLTVTLTCKSPKVGDINGAIGFQHSDNFVISFSTATVESSKLNGSGDGKEATWDISLIASIKDDGTEPVVTADFA